MCVDRNLNLLSRHAGSGYVTRLTKRHALARSQSSLSRHTLKNSLDTSPVQSPPLQDILVGEEPQRGVLKTLKGLVGGGGGQK